MRLLGALALRRSLLISPNCLVSRRLLPRLSLLSSRGRRTKSKRKGLYHTVCGTALSLYDRRDLLEKLFDGLLEHVLTLSTDHLVDDLSPLDEEDGGDVA